MRSNCGTSLEIRDDAVGEASKCPACGARNRKLWWALGGVAGFLLVAFAMVLVLQSAQHATAPVPGPMAVLPSAPGGRGWRAIRCDVTNRFGAFVVTGAYFGEVTIVIDPSQIDVKNLSETSWEVRGEETSETKLEVFSFSGVGDLQELENGLMVGLLRYSGPTSTAAIVRASIRLKGHGDWISVSSVIAAEVNAAE